jgi:hypothetical protein
MPGSIPRPQRCPDVRGPVGQGKPDGLLVRAAKKVEQMPIIALKEPFRDDFLVANDDEDRDTSILHCRWRLWINR